MLRPRSSARERGGAALGLALLLWSVVLALSVSPAQAHPLGDFTVNTHIGLRVEPAAVALDVILDIAEIPTLRLFPGVSAESSDAVSEADRSAYRDRTCPALRDAVGVKLGGVPVALDVVDSTLSFPPGSAGLATARLHCALRSASALVTAGQVLVLTDTLAVQPVGWREITAVGDGVVLAASDVPVHSVSAVLRDYPDDMLPAPLDQRGATVKVVAGSGVVIGAPADTGGSPTTPLRGVDPLTSAFLDLVSTTRLSAGFSVLAVALAVALGGLHAFAPGHGKTLIAAYLVGRNNLPRHAALIGVSVTLTHTAGVLVLGALLSAAVLTAPEQAYRWLSLASGLLLVAIGLGLLRSALHGHNHHHGQADHSHDHESDHRPGHAARIRDNTARPHTGADGARDRSAVSTAAPVPEQPDGPRTHTRPADRSAAAGRNRGLIALGFTGGLVPSPSALVVLLGGIALGRTWFGVLLVLAYGVGMALALVGTGLLLLRTRGRIERWSAAHGRTGRHPTRALSVVRALPQLTASAVVVLGASLTAQALTRL